MSVFQLLECEIALGGDILNVVHRNPFNPVTFPELLVLGFIHGGMSAITNVYDVGAVDREDDVEMSRLRETYTDEVIKTIFPGAGVRLPNGDNKYRPRIISPDKELPLTPPKPEVVHAPGSTDFAAQAQIEGPAAFVPTAEPKHDEDPFGEADNGPTSTPPDANAQAEAGKGVLKPQPAKK